MPDETLLASAFLVGLIGSTHCIGMCGGVVSALTFGLRDDIRQSRWRFYPYLLAYNGGRIMSYTLAGALAGGVSGLVFSAAPPETVRLVVRLLTGGFMMALGLYLAGLWPGLQTLEKWGGGLWRRIEPLGRRFLPIRHPVQALAFGLVWGWLPCGMVYAVLGWALTRGTASDGAQLMLAFGLGTLPMLLTLGAAAERLRSLTRYPQVRQGAGLLVLLFGVYTLVMPSSHDQAHTAHSPVPAESPHVH